MADDPISALLERVAHLLAELAGRDTTGADIVLEAHRGALRALAVALTDVLNGDLAGRTADMDYRAGHDLRTSWEETLQWLARAGRHAAADPQVDPTPDERMRPELSTAVAPVDSDDGRWADPSPAASAVVGAGADPAKASIAARPANPVRELWREVAAEVGVHDVGEPDDESAAWQRIFLIALLLPRAEANRWRDKARDVHEFTPGPHLLIPPYPGVQAVLDDPDDPDRNKYAEDLYGRAGPAAWAEHGRLLARLAAVRELLDRDTAVFGDRAQLVLLRVGGDFPLRGPDASMLTEFTANMMNRPASALRKSYQEVDAKPSPEQLLTPLLDLYSGLCSVAVRKLPAKPGWLKENGMISDLRDALPEFRFTQLGGSIRSPQQDLEGNIAWSVGPETQFRGKILWNVRPIVHEGDHLHARGCVVYGASS